MPSPNPFDINIEIYFKLKKIYKEVYRNIFANFCEAFKTKGRDFLRNRCILNGIKSQHEIIVKSFHNQLINFN